MAARFSTKEILFLGIVLPAILAALGIAVTKGTDVEWGRLPGSRQAPKAGAGNRKIPDPVSALNRLSRARNESEKKGAGAEILRLGDAALPALRAGIYGATEAPEFRMEAVAILGQLPGPAAEKKLVEVFRDPTLEEKYRIVALAKLIGRSTESVFQAISQVYSSEPAFNARHLLVKALGDSGRPEATPLLTEAVVREPEAAARIQAAESLGTRSREAGVLDLLRARLLADPDEQVRRACLASISRSGDASVQPLLETIAASVDQPESLRAAAKSWLDRNRPR